MSELLTLRLMSRRLGMTQRWLREQANQGLVPCLKDGNRYLFNVEATIEAVASMAANKSPEDD